MHKCMWGGKWSVLLSLVSGIKAKYQHHGQGRHGGECPVVPPAGTRVHGDNESLQRLAVNFDLSPADSSLMMMNAFGNSWHLKHLSVSLAWPLAGSLSTFSTPGCFSSILGSDCIPCDAESPRCFRDCCISSLF